MGELVRSSSSHTGPGEPATPGRGRRHVGGARWGSEGPSSQCAPPYLACPGVLEGEGDCSVSFGDSLLRAHCPLLTQEAAVQGPPQKDLL